MIAGMVGPFVSLMLLLVLAGAALAMGTAWLIANVMLRPPRMTDGKALYLLGRLVPSDLGLPFEPMDFRVRDERTGRSLRLAGWWIPASSPSDRCVVLIHGYADAKVGSIAWAPTLHRLGCNVLAIDLRAHGESEGRHCTGGFFERHDLSQVLDELSARKPRQTRQMVLFGLSLGAGVALATARLRDDLAGVILDSPYTCYEQATLTHARRMGSVVLLQPLATRLAEQISGANFAQVAPLRLVEEVGCPILLIQSGRDAFVGTSGNTAMAVAVQNHRPGGTVFLVEPAEHLMALSMDERAYRQAMETWFGSLSAASPGARENSGFSPAQAVASPTSDSV